MSIWSELLFLHGHIASPRLLRALAAKPDPKAAVAAAPPVGPGDPHQGDQGGLNLPAVGRAAHRAGPVPR